MEPEEETDLLKDFFKERSPLGPKVTTTLFRPKIDCAPIEKLHRTMLAAYDYITTKLSANARPLWFGVPNLVAGGITLSYSHGMFNPHMFFSVINAFAGTNLSAEGEPGAGKTEVPEDIMAAVYNLSAQYVHQARIQGNPNATEEKLNAYFDLALLVKDGVKKVIPTFFIQSFYKMVDEGNRFPPEILSFLYPVLNPSESFIQYGGEEIKSPKGPKFQATNYADSGNSDMPFPYRDRWAMVVQAIGANPALIQGLFIEDNGPRIEQLESLALKARLDDMGGKFKEFVEEVYQEIKLAGHDKQEALIEFIASHIEINAMGTYHMKDSDKQDFMNKLKTAESSVSADIVYQKAFTKFNHWIENESNFIKNRKLVKQVPWTPGAITLFTEVATQTKYCVGINPDPNRQVRETIPFAFQYCPECPIVKPAHGGVADNAKNLICNKFEVVEGKGLGTRWIKNVVEIARWVAVMVGKHEVDEEILTKTAGAVLHGRVQIREDGYKEINTPPEKIDEMTNFVEALVYDLFDKAGQIIKKEAVKNIYTDFQDIVARSKKYGSTEEESKLLAENIIDLIGRLKDYTILPSPSRTSLVLQLSEIISDLIKKFSPELTTHIRELATKV